MSRLRSGAVALFFVAMAAVAGGCSSSSPPISVSLSPSFPQAIDQGQTLAITATVTNGPANMGVSWSLTGPGSLSNATAISVTYNAPTTNFTSPQQAIVTATPEADQMKTSTVQITVNPYPQIPSQTLISGSVGAPYSQPIELTGGTPPFQWSVYDGPIITGYMVGGAVPDGLSLDPKTGTITGTPTGGGTWYFEATVTDATGASVVNGFLSIQINPGAQAGTPVPFLNQTLMPTAVSPGNPAFTLSVSGTGFVSGATVDFNRAALPTTYVDSEHLTSTVSAADISNAGTAAVTVLNPGPAGGTSNVVYFQVAAPETTVTFAAAANSPLQIPEPYGIAVGDFNEDGKPDLVVTANVRVYSFLGNGDGTFAPAAGSPIRVLSPPYDDAASPYTGPLASGDFNHSGHLGLAVGEFQNEAAVVLLGNGNGTFVPSSAAFANALGQPTSGLAAADFNADGNLDLAIANEFSGQSPVLLGYGSGAFNWAGDLYHGIFPVGVVAGDFNADGKLDAVVASGGSAKYPGSGVTVSLGNGDGTFAQASGSPISLGQSLSAVVACDFNGDGKLDLALTDSVGNAVIILLGNGDGTFGPPTTIPVGNQPYAIVAGDFNNDGKLDLAVANYGDGTITLLLGNGDGTFTQASGSPYAVGRGPFQIAAADFNGDGKLDLAVANSTDGTVSILLQQ
ncbi:MAG: VCBS repeat-containing protein [Candidatus Acidiferrum sp.]